MIRYVSIGDSYTSGVGTIPSQSWPNLLTRRLQKDGVEIQLVANPAQNGFTTLDAWDEEIPVVEKEKPDFVTVMLGVNDFVQEVEKDEFRGMYGQLLDNVVKNSKKAICLTVPDFTLTPNGRLYDIPEKVRKGIEEFNSVIMEEAEQRGIKVIDIYPYSQKNDPELVAKDGLHPSAKQYDMWVDVMYPIVKAELSKII